MSGWRADWRQASEQLRLHREGLLRRIGHRFKTGWVAWDARADEWFADLPVILQFDDGEQLELCWMKFDDLSISWNTIDLSRPPEWFGSFELEWRATGHAALDAVRGAQLESVWRTEHLFTTTLVSGEGPPRTSSWLTGGVWFATTAAGLHVYNALDENALSNEAPVDGPEARLSPI